MTKNKLWKNQVCCTVQLLEKLMWLRQNHSLHLNNWIKRLPFLSLFFPLSDSLPLVCLVLPADLLCRLWLLNWWPVLVLSLTSNLMICDSSAGVSGSSEFTLTLQGPCDQASDLSLSCCSAGFPIGHQVLTIQIKILCHSPLKGLLVSKLHKLQRPL